MERSRICELCGKVVNMVALRIKNLGLGNLHLGDLRAVDGRVQ